MRWAFFASLVLFLAASRCLADPPQIAPDQAREYVGQTVTVRGKVVDARWAPGLSGKPTILCLDKPFGSKIFFVIIYQKDRSKFSFSPEKQLKDRTIRVTGRVQIRGGTPEIVVTDPSQIGVEDLGTEDRG